jgi:protein-L-isoaspartate(D-aspartate) O-methyltransferase
MMHVDRGKYVPQGLPPYADCPQPIGDGQTISAPHMHAQALELLGPFLKSGSHALDIGCGSGYLTSCMGRLVAPTGTVIGIENRESLVDLSRRNITEADGDLLSAKTVDVRLGNAWTGEGFLPEDQQEEMFDAIHVGAAADKMPDILIGALKRPGRMVIPLGPQWGSQVFVVVDKDKDGGISQRELLSVMYVPLENRVRPRGQ